ncbi:MAG: hypothetical protein J7J38_03750 [Candidatus Aenigmarchaeota archaeon]|nr:hypothetical protein [Candidatus Aenigmarchaeota archaeon]
MLMPKTRLENDIERLENRMRTNFFDIEKRLNTLEAASSVSALEEFRERLQELEDLQMLLQTEIMQIKQKIIGEEIEMPAGDVEKRIEKLEETISKGVPVAVDEDIEKRLESLEKASDVKEVKKMIEKLGFETKNLDALSKRIDDIEKQLKENQRYFNKKIEELEDLSEKSGKMLSEKGMKIFLNKINDAKIDISKKLDEIESVRENLEKVIKDRRDLIKKIDDSEVAISKADVLLTKIITQEEKVRSDLKKIEALKDRINSRIDDRIGEMESIKEDVDEKINKIKEIMNNTNKALSTEFNEKINELKTFAETTDKNLVALTKNVKNNRNEIEEMINGISNKIKMIEARTGKKIDDKIKGIESELNKNMESKIIDIKNDIISNSEKNFKDISNELSKKTDEINQINEKINELKTFGEMTDKNLVALTKNVKNNRNEIETLIQTSVDLSKKTEKIRQVVNDIKTENENKFTNFIKEYEIIKNSNHDIRNNVKKINETVENLKTQIIDNKEKLDKISVNEIEKQKEEINKIKNIGKELDKLNNKINIIENSVYDRSAKLLTDNLRKFSRIVDKKFESLPDKNFLDNYKNNLYNNLYAKLHSEIMNTISKKHAPVTREYVEQLAKRISIIEGQISKMRELLKGVSVRVPVIVE